MWHESQSISMRRDWYDGCLVTQGWGPSQQLSWVLLNSKGKSQNPTHFQLQTSSINTMQAFFLPIGLLLYWDATLFIHTVDRLERSASSKALFFLGFQISYFLTRLVVFFFSNLIFVAMFNLNLSLIYLYSWSCYDRGTQEKDFCVEGFALSLYASERWLGCKDTNFVINPLMRPCMAS